MLATTIDKYVSLEKKVYMSVAEADELSRALGHQFARLTPPPDLAVGLANGALMTTRIAAEEFGIPYIIVKVRRKGSRIKQNLRLVKKLFRVPTWILASKPVGLLSTAFDRRFSQIEQTGPADDPFGDQVTGKTVVIIDDCIDTGSSVSHVRKQLAAAGAKTIHVAVLCWSSKNNTQDMFGVVPDLFLHRRIHYYPWSNNSPYYKDFLEWLDAHSLSLWK